MPSHTAMRVSRAVRSLIRHIRARSALLGRRRNQDLAALEQSLAQGSAHAVLQPWTTTAENRYPLLFDRLVALLEDTARPRVLSFGCAGGEEVRALRRRLPRATVVGIDVNPRAIARARRRDREAPSRYVVSDRPPPGETFDAVLALAVFRHGSLAQQRPQRCTTILPFSRAAEIFAALDTALRPGGVLAWGNAHFRLADLPGGDHYQLIDTSDELDPSEIVYGVDDHEVPAGGHCGGLYRKAA